MNRCRIGLIAIAAVITASAALAQTPTAPPSPRAARPAVVPNNAELATILDAYAIVQAQNALQLTDDQYGRFVAKLKRLQDTRRRTAQARRRVMAELRKLTADPDVSEASLRDRLAALRALEEEGAEAVRRDHAEVDAVLDARQQIRFRIFEHELEGRKLDLLVRARQHAARARPDGP